MADTTPVGDILTDGETGWLANGPVVQIDKVDDPSLAVAPIAADAKNRTTAKLWNTTLQAFQFLAGWAGGTRVLGAAMSVVRFGQAIGFGASGPIVVAAAGSPVGIVPAPVGSVYMRTDGGTDTTLYIKETGGATSAGWVVVDLAASAETLAQTLVLGNTTGATNIVVDAPQKVLFAQKSHGTAGTSGAWDTGRTLDHASAGGSATVAVGAAFHTRATGGTGSVRDIVRVRAAGSVRVDSGGSTSIYQYTIDEDWQLDTSGPGGARLTNYDATGAASLAPGDPGRVSFEIVSGALVLVVDEGNTAADAISVTCAAGVVVSVGGMGA